MCSANERVAVMVKTPNYCRQTEENCPLPACVVACVASGAGQRDCVEKTAKGPGRTNDNDEDDELSVFW